MLISVRKVKKELVGEMEKVDDTRKKTESLVMFNGNDPTDSVCRGLRDRYNISKVDVEQFLDESKKRAAYLSWLPISAEKHNYLIALVSQLRRIDKAYKTSSQTRQKYAEISSVAFMQGKVISQNLYSKVASSEWVVEFKRLESPDSSTWQVLAFDESKFLEWWDVRQKLVLENLHCPGSDAWRDTQALFSSIVYLLEYLELPELSGTDLDQLFETIYESIKATAKNLYHLLQYPETFAEMSQLFGYCAPVIYVALNCLENTYISFCVLREKGNNDLIAEATYRRRFIQYIDRLAYALQNRSKDLVNKADSIHNAETKQAIATLEALCLAEFGLKEICLSSQKGRQLGFGSFSVVYEQYVPGGMSCYAVKEPTVKNGLDNDTILHKVRREAWIWKQLDHKNVLPLRGFCQLSNELPGLVMDVCRCSLKDFVCICSPVTEKKKLDLLRGVSAGLAYLHSEKIAHGDLRARNILVKEFTANNGIDKDHLAVIADFGVAWFVDDASNPTHVQEKFALSYDQVGNPNWLSPELLRKASLSDRGAAEGEGCICISAPGDIYSFGCVFLEAMFERDPYQSFDSEEEKKTKKLSGVLPATLEETSATYFPFLCSTWDSEPANRPLAESVLHQMDEFMKPFAL